MRRAAKTDNNHSDVRDFLRGIGCSVADTSGAGEGFPDLVVGYRGKNFMIEIKDCEKEKAESKLTPAQIKFHAGWNGQIDIVTGPDDALATIQRYLQKYKQEG